MFEFHNLVWNEGFLRMNLTFSQIPTKIHKNASPVG